MEDCDNVRGVTHLNGFYVDGNCVNRHAKVNQI